MGPHTRCSSSILPDQDWRNVQAFGSVVGDNTLTSHLRENCEIVRSRQEQDYLEGLYSRQVQVSSLQEPGNVPFRKRGFTSEAPKEMPPIGLASDRKTSFSLLNQQSQSLVNLDVERLYPGKIWMGDEVPPISSSKKLTMLNYLSEPGSSVKVPNLSTSQLKDQRLENAVSLVPRHREAQTGCSWPAQNFPPMAASVYAVAASSGFSPQISSASFSFPDWLQQTGLNYMSQAFSICTSNSVALQGRAVHLTENNDSIGVNGQFLELSLASSIKKAKD
eukprot:c23814_g1_i1 orf=735-1565(+)